MDCKETVLCKTTNLIFENSYVKKNNRMKTKYIFCILLIVGLKTNAQTGLPNFTVSDKGNSKVVISWINPYENLVQLCVQRSYDSVKMFKTIFSTESPELPQNGFTDQLKTNARVYYRIFYTMKGGAYFFSSAKLAQISSASIIINNNKRDFIPKPETPKIGNEKTTFEDLFAETKQYTIFNNDTVFSSMKGPVFKGFRDSLLLNTKDTLSTLGKDSVAWKTYEPPFVYSTSKFLFINNNGHLTVKLDEAPKKKYDLKITDELDKPILIFKNIKEDYFIIDKTNFYKSGWYRFELIENNRVKERNKFFLPKDI